MAPIIRGNSLYTIVDGPSWTQAEANSVKLGGHLVTINDQSENLFVYNIALASNAGLIGLYDPTGKDQWVWSSGDQSSYLNWSPEKRPYVGIEKWANILYADTGQKYSGYWNTHQSGLGMYNSSGISETPFIRRGDSAYVIVQGPTWEEAEANAVKLGGHLVTINDAAENNFLYNSFIQPKVGTPFLPEPFVNGFRYWGAYWIGLSDKINEGNWQWISGENSNYSNWYGNVGGDDAHGGQDYGVFGWQWSNSWDDGGGPGGGKQEGLYGIAEIKLSTPTPTYTLTTSAPSIIEGEQFTTTVTTTNVPIGTILYFALSGTGITNDDFSPPFIGTVSPSGLNGSGVVTSNGTFSFTHYLPQDLTPEKNEVAEIKLYSDAARTIQVGNTASVSFLEAMTVTRNVKDMWFNLFDVNGGVIPVGSVINEGSTLSIKLDTMNVGEGVKFYYALGGTGITTADFSTGDLTGELVTDRGGKAILSYTLANDLTTEGTESLDVKLYRDIARTIQVRSTSSVLINDTSNDTSISPVITNTGAAAFFISGKGDVGSQLFIIKTKDDQEGNGKFTYKWQSSVDGTNWTNLASTSYFYTVAATDASKQLRASISYLDGKSNSESVDTSALSISAVASQKVIAGDFATPVNINLSLPAYQMSGNWNIDKYYYYVEQYPMTLRTAFYNEYLAVRYTNEALYGQNHYLSYGQAEGRVMVDTSGILSDSNDYGAYVENYGITLLDIYRKDPRAVVNGGTMSMFAWGKEHYTNWGKAEGREITGGVEWGGIVRNNLALYNQWQDARLTNPALSAFAFGYQRQNTIKSTLGVLVGSDTPDKLTGQIAYGLNGNDVICSDGGRGILAGGFGDDLLVAANGGSDLAYGGPGSDIFQLNAGSSFNIRDFRKGADMIQLGSTLTSSGVTIQWDSADDSTLFYNGTSVIGKVYGKRPTEFTYSDSTNGVSKVYI